MVDTSHIGCQDHEILDPLLHVGFLLLEVNLDVGSTSSSPTLCCSRRVSSSSWRRYQQAPCRWMTTLCQSMSHPCFHAHVLGDIDDLPCFMRHAQPTTALCFHSVPVDIQLPIQLRHPLHPLHGPARFAWLANTTCSPWLFRHCGVFPFTLGNLGARCGTMGTRKLRGRLRQEK